MNLSGISVRIICVTKFVLGRRMADHVTGMEVHRQEGTTRKVTDVFVVHLLRQILTTEQEERKYVATLHQRGK
jgi:hypothetical protein